VLSGTALRMVSVMLGIAKPPLSPVLLTSSAGFFLPQPKYRHALQKL